MIVKNNIPIYSVSWLNHVEGGMIGTFYEPENKEELIELCMSLYKENKTFDLIGHTSNIYYLPNYSVDTMVSTRRVKEVKYQSDLIIADCGVSVKTLARAMVDEGVKGFEGLIDLPGTVAASVCGNASCYDCSINSILVSVEFLKESGEIITLKPEDLKLSKRSSALKRGELGGVILSVTLRKEVGDAEQIKTLADKNHETRTKKQPGPKDNLGSIYSDSKKWSVKGIILHTIAKAVSFLLKPIKQVSTTNIILYMTGCKELIPYVWGWNRFIWKDEESHKLFWKYHQIHKKLFLINDFEIIIKGNPVY